MRQGMVCFLFILPLLAEASADRPLPERVNGSLELEKTTLSLSYNPVHKQADWVFYSLGPNEIRNCVKRSNRFAPDPELRREDSATLADYKSSGFDRGHLSPAADNKFSAAAMRDSFLLSNISPQPPGFNQGIWARLENLVRAWALKFGGIWVATGPVLEEGLPTIGASRVSTPRAYYKVLVTQSGKARKALALLLPVTAQGDLSQFAKTIDEVEQQSRLDFNPGLPGEEALETRLDLSGWEFNARYTPLPCQSQSLPSLFDSLLP